MQCYYVNWYSLYMYWIVKYRAEIELVKFALCGLHLIIRFFRIQLEVRFGLYIFLYRQFFKSRKCAVFYVSFLSLNFILFLYSYHQETRLRRGLGCTGRQFFVPVKLTFTDSEKKGMHKIWSCGILINWLLYIHWFREVRIMHKVLTFELWDFDKLIYFPDHSCCFSLLKYCVNLPCSSGLTFMSVCNGSCCSCVNIIRLQLTS